MFSSLRQGSMVYILRKGENPTLQIGTVTSVSDPKPKMGTMPTYGQMQPTVVGIGVKVGDNNFTFENLDSGAVIITYPNENTVVSTSREAMNAEVDAMLRNSKQILESVPYHENVLKSCDSILRELNPQFAKEKEQEEKISRLETQMGDMQGTLTDIRAMLSNALSGGNTAASRKAKDA